MNRGVYATASGMIAGQQWMDVIANNLANASTAGFKRDSVNFDEAMLRTMQLDGRTVGEIGAGPSSNGTFTIFTAGPLQETGNTFDFAILKENGMFAVQTANGVRYTRDGAFGVRADRTLVDKSGNPVLDSQNRPIQIPAGKIGVGEDGNLQVDGKDVAKLGVFDVDRRDPFDLGFLKEGANLYRPSRQVKAVDVPVRNGVLEGSNVDPVDSMVQMIALSRAFEMAQRSIQSQDELSQRLIQSLQDR